MASSRSLLDDTCRLEILVRSQSLRPETPAPSKHFDHPSRQLGA